MKFKFRFATVLKLRKIEKDLAYRDFAKAEADVREQLNKINSLYLEIDRARLLAAATDSGKPVSLPQLGHTEDFVKLQLIRIDRERHTARELLTTMEEKQEILAEKGKSLRMIEILKEKDLEKFKHESAKVEQRELDDIWMTRPERRKVNV